MKKIITTSFLFIFLLIGCQDDFLDVPRYEDVLTEGGLANTDEGARALVTSVYAKFLDWNISSFPWIGVSSITSDDADKGSVAGDTGADKDLLDNLTWNATSPSFNEVYRGNYEAINKANFAIEQLPLITGANPVLRTQLDGEAKFLRAFCYFTLVRCFGPVPLVDHIKVSGNVDDEAMLVVRRPVNDIYAFIDQDLTSAIASLPDKSTYDANNKGRVSKGSALALLAKVKLYRQQWSEVIALTSQISGYTLTTNYEMNYRFSGEFNNESMFEINSYTGDPIKGIDKYSKVQGPRGGTSDIGWGFNTPSSSLLAAYEAGDKRKDATIIFAGQLLYDGFQISSATANPRYNYKAYSSAFPSADVSDTNIKYLRYAEVLLLRAEAFNELNDLPNAKLELNKVRTRAGLPNTAATTQADLRIAIWKERRVELAFEHDRWFDLIRTGQAEAAMAIHGKTFVVGKHELFPIPQAVVDESNGVTTQNPNY